MPTKITTQANKLNIHSCMDADRRQETPKTKDFATHGKKHTSIWIGVLVFQTQDLSPRQKAR